MPGGLPYFLHSCGMILKILDDLIDDVRIDGKHSYEDAIIPVQDFQSMVRGKIAVLGGLDINILSGGTPEEVRNRTRYLLKVVRSRGRYAIGSGNSVPSYVPVENYLAMVGRSTRITHTTPICHETNHHTACSAFSSHSLRCLRRRSTWT